MKQRESGTPPPWEWDKRGPQMSTRQRGAEPKRSVARRFDAEFTGQSQGKSVGVSRHRHTHSSASSTLALENRCVRGSKMKAENSF